MTHFCWQRLLCCFPVLLLCVACQPDPLFEEDEPLPPQVMGYPDIDERLWPYMEAFEEEAAQRGHRVDLRAFNLIASVGDIPEEHVAGVCSYGYYTDRQITIDAAFFTSAGAMAREMVVFHELGHCYLERGHREDQFENGICKSIMRSGTEGCVDYYVNETRDYFLDELFEDLD